MKIIKILILAMFVFISCKVKQVVDRNQNSTSDDYNKIYTSALKEKPRCFTLNCDSVMYCYENILSLYLNDSHNLPFRDIVDCVYQKLKQGNQDANDWLLNFYTAAFVKGKIYNINSGTPYRMDDFRGEDAFHLALKYYKFYSTDQQYFPSDPSTIFNNYVIKGMVKSINGLSFNDWQNGYTVQLIENNWQTKYKGEDGNKHRKEWWLKLYGEALKAGTIEFRKYGE
jgi:hypothetical protein